MTRPSLAAILALAVLAMAPLPAGAESDSAESDGHHHVHETMAGDAPLPGRSIYQLTGAWVDPAGKPLQLAALRGRPVLVLLFYGTCQSACPVLVRDLQRVDEQLSPEERAGLRYLLVTFDPEVDTPERLAVYAKEHGLAGDRWTLARGTPEQVRELAAVLGVKYRPTGDGQYSHTQRITLLDREGVVIEKFDGMDRPLDPIVDAARRFAAPPPAGAH
jgi:protein SCO1/2